MSRLLPWLARHGAAILPLALAIGLLTPPLAAFMRPAIAPAVFIMLAIIMVRVDAAAAFSHLRKPALFVAGLAWALIATPLLFAVCLRFAPQGHGLDLALIMWASAPPIFSSAALAWLLGLDGALSTAFLLAAIALHPLATPLAVATLTQTAATISSLELALRLAGLIAGAGLIAIAVRTWLGEARRARAGDHLDGLNVAAMVVFAIGLMDGIPAQLLARPGFALALTAFVFALHLGLNLMTTALFWRWDRRRALALGFSSSGRNIAIAIGALAGHVPDDTWLYFAVIQFPIYVLPMLLKPAYRLIATRYLT